MRLYLPLDVTRCLDAGCPERTKCLRWLDQRTDTDDNPPTAASLFPFDLPLRESCPHRIPPEDGAE